MEIDCPDDVRVLDLGSGALTTMARPYAVAGDQVDGRVVADRYVWWETVEIPASGLEPPGRRFTLWSRALDGSGTDDLVVLSGDEYSYVTLVGVHGSRIASIESVGPGDESGAPLVLREVDGREVARFDGGGNDLGEPFDGILVGYEFAVDRSTHRQTSWPSGRHRRLRAGAPLRRGRPSQRRGSSALAASRRRRRPVDRPRGGTPFVLNRSREVVGVDSATGQQTSVSDDLYELAEILMNSGQASFDSATGTVLMLDGARQRARVATIPECKVR